MTFSETIHRFCLAQKLLTAGDAIVVGVSGGPDSMALLYVLNELRASLGLKLFVAHLNHGLRRQATREQCYVKETAKELRLPFFTKKIHIKKTKGSLEEIAREARLKFLYHIARQTKSCTIALGHHQDDLAETILMRLLRGTGLDGIRSILPARTLQGFKVIRPLLVTNRDDIIKFLNSKKIKSFQDISNRNKKFMRNKIRLDLLTQLKKDYNPHIVQTLASFSQQAGLAYDYIHQESLRAFKNSCQKVRGTKKIALAQSATERLHDAILTEVIRLTIERILGHTRKLTAAHISEAVDLIRCRPAASVVHLPYDICIKKEKDRIVFSAEALQKGFLIKEKNTL
jgi:tRNA(Ile)-lysidine synthase